MKHARPRRFAGSRGFTLVESIIVVVVLSIAAAGIISLQGNIFRGQSVNKKIQVGVQLMQECAELILATRRVGTNGYTNSSLADSAAATSKCSGITLSGYAAPTVTITYGDSTTTGFSGCPSSVSNSCMQVSITQGSLTPITLMLVSY